MKPRKVARVRIARFLFKAAALMWPKSKFEMSYVEESQPVGSEWLFTWRLQHRTSTRERAETAKEL